jgi:hypothetical protein
MNKRDIFNASLSASELAEFAAGVAGSPGFSTPVSRARKSA